MAEESVSVIVNLKTKLSKVETYLQNQAKILDYKTELFLRLKTLIDDEDFVLKNIEDFVKSIDSIEQGDLTLLNDTILKPGDQTNG